MYRCLWFVCGQAEKRGGLGGATTLIDGYEGRDGCHAEQSWPAGEHVASEAQGAVGKREGTFMKNWTLLESVSFILAFLVTLG